MAYFWTIFSMAVWDTFRRSVATVANRRLDIAQRVVDRVAENTENTRRPIFVRVELGADKRALERCPRLLHYTCPCGWSTVAIFDSLVPRRHTTCAVALPRALPHFMLCC